MNHAVEYFHSLVEHEFTRDQYEVSYNEGKYHVTITIPDDNKSPMSYYIYMMHQKRMEKCLHGFIKPGNLKLSVILPIKLMRRNLKEHYARLNRILRVDSPTESE
jgi:hypothetical protein